MITNGYFGVPADSRLILVFPPGRLRILKIGGFSRLFRPSRFPAGKFLPIFQPYYILLRLHQLSVNKDKLFIFKINRDEILRTLKKYTEKIAEFKK